MTRKVNATLYVVEGTLTDANIRYPRNIIKSVFAKDLYRALEIFKEEYPTATVHIISRAAGSGSTVLIDETSLESTEG